MAKETKKKEEKSFEDERAEALQAAIKNIEKSFGKGSIMKFGDKVDGSDLEVIPTGSLGLDIALGVGGLPRGRIIEIYGPESSGKTTMTLHMIAQAQKLGGVVAFIDAEHALDPVYAQKLGVNINEMYISQPDDGEQALEIVDEMVRSAAIDVIVVDSVAALVPKVEIEGNMGASHVGLQARLMSQALRKLTSVAYKNNCLIMFTNQLREKIGVMFGNPETTTGGRALKFYASVRLDIRKGEAIKVGDKQIGSRTKVKVAKNKVAPPFKLAEFDIIFGEGISHTGELLDLGIELEVCSKSGAWFYYGEERLGQGRENAKEYLEENPEILLDIENKIRKEFNLKTLEEMKESAEKLRQISIENATPKAGKGKGKGKGGKGKAAKGKETDEPEADNNNDGDNEELEIPIDEDELNAMIAEMEIVEEGELNQEGGAVKLSDEIAADTE